MHVLEKFNAKYDNDNKQKIVICFSQSSVRLWQVGLNTHERLICFLTASHFSKYDYPVSTDYPEVYIETSFKNLNTAFKKVTQDNITSQVNITVDKDNIVTFSSDSTYNIALFENTARQIPQGGKLEIPEPKTDNITSLWFTKDKFLPLINQISKLFNVITFEVVEHPASGIRPKLRCRNSTLNHGSKSELTMSLDSSMVEEGIYENSTEKVLSASYNLKLLNSILQSLDSIHVRSIITMQFGKLSNIIDITIYPSQRSTLGYMTYSLIHEYDDGMVERTDKPHTDK